MTMSFGEEILAILQRRGLQSHFRYADIQAIKAVADAEEMRVRLTAKGYSVEPERTELLHFADWITIEILKKKLSTAKTVAVILAFT